MKQMKLLAIIFVLVLSFSKMVEAKNTEIVNFMTNELTFCRLATEKQLYSVLGDENKQLFTSKVVREEVYTTTDVNLRAFPNVYSDIAAVIPKDSELIRVGKSKCGWDIILLEDQKFFMWTDYLTTDHPGIATIVTRVPDELREPEIVVTSNTTTVAQKKNYRSSKGYSEKEARNEIAYRESRGSYDARNGKYIGKYQLDKAYLNGDYSPKNQERTANRYVKKRYGSWRKALEFWNTHGWY